MADDGCLAVNRDEALRIHAPVVRAVDGCGAGATFLAGFIYGRLMGWEIGKISSLCHCSGNLESNPSWITDVSN